MKAKIVKIYADEQEREPFLNWLNSLKDRKTRNRIRRRIDRIEDGNLGDYKSVGEEIFEMRLFFGPGYRIYFANDQDTIVILLWGGDKSTQAGDIKKAKQYWQDYKRRFK